ncbi:HEAT repeat domain-containing protein [Labilibaculum antarcticum]|nr:HEAT repeat domain-containing protein [Labilibaculum antarcticum]
MFFERIHSFIEYIFERLPYNVLNRLIIYMIIGFFTALVLLLPSILFSKLYITYRKNKKKLLIQKYSKLVVRFLIDDLSDKELSDLKRIKSKFHRKVITSVLIAIDTAENKVVSNQIRTLYLDMKLNEDSSRKLRKRWHHKIRGIRELSHMRVKKDNKYIMDFLQKPNEILRIESQLGLIKLLPFVPFAFLDSQEKPFTVWEQINVFDLIRKNRIEIPEFTLWLDHWNDSVVMFCLDMIRILKQRESVPKLMELLNHENDLVKGKVIRTLVDLESKEAVVKLKELFVLEELPNQINIIRSIGQLRLESEMDFLVKKSNDEEFKIRMECCKSLALIGESGQEKLKVLAENGDEELKRIIKHVLDPRI